ncbi:exocyst complex component 2-like [Clavelina lepadiformis]|uniref:Exocyst complex component 2 n=1 Tax=Clavelina lepadiformis TaxID=159417 RepID=A0ABP0F720_CLALP
MPAPVVTGISPKEGTPGTKVTIRGENLGQSQSDILGVAICNKNCSMTADWISSSKIVCRTSTGVGKGDIIVMTRSGGTGTSTVHFTGIELKKVGPLESCPIWVDETEYVDQRLGRAQKSKVLSLRTDPLGLNSEEAGNKTQTRMQLAELFVRGSPDPTDENFVPSWYLVERHATTPFSKLKDGHAYMKRRANRNTNNAPLNHVKDSLPVFFEVHETLSGIHHRMVKDDLGSDEGNVTERLEETLNEASGRANKLFDTVLSCKDRADSIRNTLNVLQRFKFLFNLPLNIERNIQRGDYGVVINDYEKAKSLFSDTDVSVFKKVYDEVERRVSDFREQLKREVKELPSPLHRQKMLIRYLLGLGDASDPAWDCLAHQHQWIQECMMRCKDQHLKRAIKFAEQGDDQSRVKVNQDYLEELTRIAVSQVPEHWNLWQHYSTGVILSETGEKISDVEKLKQVASKHSKQMKGLLRDTVILFVNLLRAVFLPATLCVDDDDDVTERQSYGVWPNEEPLPAQISSDCVHVIRQALSGLSQLNLPHGTLTSLHDIIHDMRVLSLNSFLLEATQEIRSLRLKETWNVNNKGITKLPSQLSTVLTELVVVVRHVLMSLPGEESIFARVAVQSKITQLLTDLFVACVTCFEETSFFEETESDALPEGLPPLEKRLLVGMSNLSFSWTTFVLTHLEQFQQLGFPNVEKCRQVCEEAFVELDEKLLSAYLEHRLEPLISGLEQGMYVGGFDWNDCLKPTGVRPYIKCALMKIITIHAEVFAVCSGMVSRILTSVVESVADELLRLVQCIDQISANGAMQCRVDIEAMEQVTSIFKSPQSQKSFEEALNAVPRLSNNSERRTLDDLLNIFKSIMMFQLNRFQP